jgi:hypothetical protein
MKYSLRSWLAALASLFAIAAVCFLASFDPVVTAAFPKVPTPAIPPAAINTDAVAFACANPAVNSGADIQRYLAGVA